MRIGLAIFTTEFEQHQFGPVIQLNAEPVPTRLIAGELLGEPFVIHPSAALDQRRVDGPRNLETRKRNVMRSSSTALGLLAHTVLALDHYRFRGPEFQMESEVAGECIEPLLFPVPLHGPVPVPDPLPFETGAGQASPV